MQARRADEGAKLQAVLADPTAAAERARLASVVQAGEAKR
jgi:hypothetical protein